MVLKKALFLFAISFGVVCYYLSFINKVNNPPIPTEFIQKKNNRKIIKEGRKKWIDNMHRSHPDVDWKKIDQKNRKLNTDKVIELRKSLLKSEDFQDMLDNFEVIVDRDIEGE